ncbi:MAG: formimidoylglutamase [Bacteroidales bacterium]|nr:formimidoylglutamase [Bacteroidales bacterium]
MDISMFLEPVSEKCFTETFRPGKNTFGETLTIYKDEEDFPDLAGFQLALVGVKEERGAVDNHGCADGADHIRKAFYKLFNHWVDLKIVDLGNIKAGKEISDTYYALNQVLTELLKEHVLPIVIGGSQDMTYTMYQVYEPTGKLINITTIDPIFDLGNDNERLNSHSYLSHIILHQPNYLFNFTNIGYQSYYVDNESVDLMKQLLFDTYRLGILKQHIELTEPLIRNANIVSFDMGAIRAADAPGVKNASPNGFNGDDACQMTRYAGLNFKLSSIGFFEYNPHYDINSRTANLIAEMIWYFIEGFSSRQDDIPTAETADDFKRYNVQIGDGEENVVFLCHKITGKWWIDMSFMHADDPRYERHHYIPCSVEDYDQAMRNELPDKWWQFYQKLM